MLTASGTGHDERVEARVGLPPDSSGIRPFYHQLPRLQACMHIGKPTHYQSIGQPTVLHACIGAVMLANVATTETPIRRECAKRGIRYSWMAQQLGVMPWTFARIEERKTPAPKGYYERAAEILGVPVSVIAPEDKTAAIAA